MVTIFKRKINKQDSNKTIINGIIKIATDKNQQLLWVDDNKWLEVKLKEVARLSRMLKKRLKL